MKSARIALSAALLAIVAASSYAALSKEYADFPKGPAQFLLTKDELTKWKSVKTDAEAKAFIDLFWARRDPTPGTPANEFRDGYDNRVKIADEKFGTARTPGSTTDRGKVFILLGGPTKIRRSQAAPQSTVQAPPSRTSDTGSPQAYSPKDVWEYEQAKMRIALGQPKVEIAFIDQYGTNDWTLERQLQTDHVAVFEKVAQSFVAQPDLREVPTFAAAAPAPQPRLTALATEGLRVAVEELRAGKAAASPNLFVSYGEYVTADGEHFVPVQLYAPASAGLDATKPVTFFGTIEKPSGETVVAVEQPATLTATTGGMYVAYSFSAIPPGDYRGTFGIARDGKAVSMLTTPIKVAGLDRGTSGVSQLILSNHVYGLKEAQQPTEPFTFGGMRVVPKSDLVFRTTDELWYFFELRNPDLDSATSKPKLSVKLTVTGKTKEGKSVKMAAPAEETPAQELKGVPGHWAVGQAMPLETFKPGEYTLAVKVTNVVTNQSFDLQSPFRIIE